MIVRVLRFFISIMSGSAAGWSCSAGRKPPRVPGCLRCGTRSPCCAVPIRGPGSTGPRKRSSPRFRQLPAELRMHRLVASGTVPRWHLRLVTQVDLAAPDGTATGQRPDRHDQGGDRSPREGWPARHSNDHVRVDGQRSHRAKLDSARSPFSVGRSWLQSAVPRGGRTANTLGAAVQVAQVSTS